LAADIVWSYFQDKFSTTHYVGVVGDNGSGKTTIGDTFAAIGYRVVTMTDPTAANIFRVLGKIEYGQCTIVMDEAEKIDKSQDIMSVLKTGSQFNGRVAKINMSS
jgi:ABC-type oligopeptide transport system ATPase subunit